MGFVLVDAEKKNSLRLSPVKHFLIKRNFVKKVIYNQQIKVELI